MQFLRFRCQKTKQFFDSNFYNTPQGLADVWTSTVQAACPYCREEHEIKIREAFLIDTLSTQIAIASHRSSSGASAETAPIS